MANANGISEYVAAAICGNFWQESGINPAIWENLNVGTWTDLGKGYGLGQWTNTGNDTHGRLYQLHDWLSTNNFDDDDGDAQLEYISVEDHWALNGSYPYPTLESFLSSTSTDLTMLTHCWNWRWEGIKDPSWDDRVKYAKWCYDYIVLHHNETKTWIKGNRYLSKSERLNNAILVFQGLGGHFTGRKKHRWVVYQHHWWQD